MYPAARVFARHAHDGAVTFEPLPTSPLHWTEAGLRAILGGLSAFFLLAGLGGFAFFSAQGRAPVFARLCPLIPFGGLALLFGLWAIAPGRRAGCPITATRDGRLLHGGSVLCRRVVSIRVERFTSRDHRTGETSESCCLYAEEEGGRFTELPRPVFSPLPGPEPAGEFAAWLAAALGVAVSDRPPPTEWSRPDREARWRRGCQTVPLFVIGVPHFMAGVAVVVFGPWYFGLIFVGSGALLLYLGVRQSGGGALAWAFLLSALVAAEAMVWAAAAWPR